MGNIHHTTVSGVRKDTFTRDHIKLIEREAAHPQRKRERARKREREKERKRERERERKREREK